MLPGHAHRADLQVQAKGKPHHDSLRCCYTDAMLQMYRKERSTVSITLEAHVWSTQTARAQGAQTRSLTRAHSLTLLVLLASRV